MKELSPFWLRNIATEAFNTVLNYFEITRNLTFNNFSQLTLAGRIKTVRLTGVAPPLSTVPA
jgi:hypothetical protein